MQDRDRVTAYWRRTFGSLKESGQLVVTGHRAAELVGYAGIVAVRRDGIAYVSAPDDLVGPITDWQPAPATITDPSWWHAHLPGWPVLGPSVHAFTDAAPAIVDQLRQAAVERITTDQLTDLRSVVDPAEWNEGGFGSDDIAYAWRATDDSGHTLAAANLTPFDGSPVDVGVLTRPDARGQGLATAVASRATAFAVREFGIARWRALITNTASRRIAERLGFEPDCLQLAIRPAENP